MNLTIEEDNLEKLLRFKTSPHILLILPDL